MSCIHLAAKHADTLPHECLRGVTATRGDDAPTALVTHGQPVANSRGHRAHRGVRHIQQHCGLTIPLCRAHGAQVCRTEHQAKIRWINGRRLNLNNHLVWTGFGQLYLNQSAFHCAIVVNTGLHLYRFHQSLLTRLSSP
jgi:hypothetical protein